MTSSLKSRLPALLLALYLFSFWALPQGWNEDNLLDGSWRYALGKYRELGFSLGRDSFFTYGPVAHWFGAPMGQERFQPWPYYLLGLLVAGVVAIHLARLFEALELSPRARILAALSLPFSFLTMEGSQEVHLVLALFLVLLSCSLGAAPATLSICSLVLVAACCLLYKISLGVLALFVLVLVLASLLARRRIGAATLALALSGYLALLYALFLATSGSHDLLNYLGLGLETAGKYSEIMIANLPYSPPNYLIALLYLAAAGVPAWAAARKVAGRAPRLCLVAALFGMALLLFKQGFVRADLAHARLFYSCVTPCIALLLLVSWGGFRARPRWRQALLASASLLIVLVYLVMLKFLPGDAGPVSLARNWFTLGHRLVAAARGEDPAQFAAKVAFIAQGQPQLFARLNQIGRESSPKGRRPSIAFYPWELLLFEGVRGFDLAPPPSLQLYADGPGSRLHALEAGLLASPQRPDLVVLGPGAIDQRSPVSELTDLLPPLWSYYHLVDLVDGYAILRANEGGKASGRAPRAATPPGSGEFFRVALDAEPAAGPLWRLATVLFKAPEQTVVLTVTSGDGQRTQYAWRGYLSQLRRGVFFSPQDLPEFLASSFGGQARHLPAAGSAGVTGAVAELRRAAGFWNLPVTPERLPLKVEHVAVR